MIEAAEAESGRAQTAIELRLVRAVMVPKLRTEVEEIRALGSPAGDGKRIEAILASTEQVLEKAEERPRELLDASGRFDGKVFRQASDRAERYGLRFCPYG